MKPLIWDYSNFKEQRTNARASPDLCCCLSCLAGGWAELWQQGGLLSSQLWCKTNLFLGQHQTLAMPYLLPSRFLLLTFTFFLLLTHRLLYRCASKGVEMELVREQDERDRWSKDTWKDFPNSQKCWSPLKRDLRCEGSSLILHPVSRVWE